MQRHIGLCEVSEQLPNITTFGATVPSFEELQETAERLRVANRELREAYERCVVLNARRNVHAADGASDAAAVARNLRMALEKSHEARLRVEEKHLLFEEAHTESRRALHEELNALQHEISEGEAEEAAFRRSRITTELREEVAALSSEVKSLEMSSESAALSVQQDGSSLRSRLASRAYVQVAEKSEDGAGDLESEDNILRAKDSSATLEEGPLFRETEMHLRRYEQQKMKLFSYGATLQRPWSFIEPELREVLSRQAGSSTSRPERVSGVEALIVELAHRYGTPEVAFLRMDLRGTGRLDAEDLGMGLLLGAFIDYRTLTGLTRFQLYSLFDQRKTGSVVAADIAACCPNLWRDHGAPPPSLRERLRSCPWSALGGSAEAFFDAVGSAPPGWDGGLGWDQEPAVTWPGFEEVVCQKLCAFSAREASRLFREVAGRSGRITLPEWNRITAEVSDPQLVRFSTR